MSFFSARCFFSALLLFCFLHDFLFGDELNGSKTTERWYENIFFTVLGQYYIVPDVSTFISAETAKQYGVEEGIIAYPGFRAGAGYEWKKWRFGIESGYTYLKGDNPLVTEIVFVPLLIKAGYVFNLIPNYDRFNITPSLGYGPLFTNVEHYETVIDIITDNIKKSSNTGNLLQVGFRVGWMPFSDLNKLIEVFAGYSLDSIIEKDGIIPLSQFELGVIVRPFSKKKKDAEIFEVQEIALHEDTEIPEEEFICNLPHVIEPEITTHTYRILFQPDTTVLVQGSSAELDKVLSVIDEYDNHKITLRGYTAPYGSVPSQISLSRERVLFCVNYLTEKLGASSGILFNIEWYGSFNYPEDIEETEHVLRRSVEIIIEGWNNP